MRWTALCFFLLSLTACNNSIINEGTKVTIIAAKDSQSIFVHGLDYAALQELKKDSLNQESWQALFPIYKMPADTSLKDMQQEMPGTYLLNDTAVIFKPDTAFKKHQQYFARFYDNASEVTSWKLIKSKVNLKGPAYIETVFQY